MEFLFVVFALSYIVIAMVLETSSERNALYRQQERVEYCKGFTVDVMTLFQYMRRVQYPAFESDFIAKTGDAWREIFGEDYMKELKGRGRNFDRWKARLLMAAEGVMLETEVAYGVGLFCTYDAETELRICRAMEKKLREHGRNVRFVIEPPPSFRKLKVKPAPECGTARWLSYCSCMIETPRSKSRRGVRMWDDDTPISSVSLERDPTMKSYYWDWEEK